MKREGCLTLKICRTQKVRNTTGPCKNKIQKISCFTNIKILLNTFKFLFFIFMETYSKYVR